ncbi:hypothetical protein HELRODRAFT_68048 [Helobdella robusta]|uniref:tRNA (guanosine(18)-2'-O)-methyltransferase TARBP1 n=1 Tax=Helobdella robusta TaxID=6412 RepID=T1FZ95_HELRO|nr:hypothetical protein HELRODRAFT_68048 [Helobdella robusta]ESN96284.1 hypothetical protein HELRODRAFT_68048 [Helobdella robusta]
MEDRDLIVVASLVESIPNLGGLCRTCEIFGIKRLVLGSLKVTSDVGFEKLSVTSHKWMNIEEVTSKNLPIYLRSMRNRGYKLVGLEQTSNSRRMGFFKFPKKSLIVLGQVANERTGIPVELMQLLDECIEIPQKGVIRSLNVHVSAAILLWEYFKQTNAIAMNSESGSNNYNINEI